MANFTVVNWPPLSDITSTKLQQMMDNDQHNKDLISASALGSIGQAKKTANQGSIAGTETLISGLTVSGSVEANRVIKITVSLRSFFSTVVNDVFALRIKQDSTQIAEFNLYMYAANVGAAGGSFITYVTPSSGSHTWDVYAIRNTGSGTGTLEASATAPAVTIVEDIGSV